MFLREVQTEPQGHFLREAPVCVSSGLTPEDQIRRPDERRALCWQRRFLALAHPPDAVFGFTRGQRMFASRPTAVLPGTEGTVMLLVPRTQDPECPGPVSKNRPRLTRR